MKRVIVDYNNLNKTILDLLVAKFPYGYEYDDIMTFQNSDGKTISTVEGRSMDTIYLVKISRALEEKMDDYMFNDTPFDEDVSDDFIEGTSF